MSNYPKAFQCLFFSPFLVFPSSPFSTSPRIDLTKDLVDNIARHYTDVTLFAKKSYSLNPLKEMQQYQQLKDERGKWRERVGRQEGMQKELQEVWREVKGALLNFYRNPGFFFLFFFFVVSYKKHDP